MSLRCARGPVVAPCSSRHQFILSWQATSQRCPTRMGTFAWWRIDHAVVVQKEVRLHRVCYCQTSSRGRFDVRALLPWSWCEELSAPLPLPVPYEATIVLWWWGGGDAGLASVWAERHGDGAVTGPSIAWARYEPL